MYWNSNCLIFGQWESLQVSFWVFGGFCLFVSVFEVNLVVCGSASSVTLSRWFHLPQTAWTPVFVFLAQRDHWALCSSSLHHGPVLPPGGSFRWALASLYLISLPQRSILFWLLPNIWKWLFYVFCPVFKLPVLGVKVWSEVLQPGWIEFPPLTKFCYFWW